MALAWLPLWCAGPPMGGEKQAAGERGVPLETEPMEKADTLPPHLSAVSAQEHKDFFRTADYVQEHNRVGITQLEFLDEDSGRVIKRVDLTALSPFNAIIAKKEKPARTGEGSGVSPVKELDAEGLAIVRGFLMDDSLIARLDAGVRIGFMGEEISAEAPGAQERQKRATVAVSHNLYIMECFTGDCRSYEAFAVLAEHRVFNKQGEVIATFRSDRGSAGAAPILTNNDRWMAVHYGSALGPDLWCPEGLLIYDVEREKPAFYYSFGEESVSSLYPVDNYFVSKNRRLNDITVAIYYPDRAARFAMTYGVDTVYTSASPEDFQENGILFFYQSTPYEPGKGDRKALFDEAFEITPLQKL